MRTFLIEILNDLRKLKSVEWVAVLLLFTRLIRWDGDETVIPVFAALGYTYHMMWYFVHVRCIESALFMSLYFRTKLLPFLTLGLFGVGKIIDELICQPFHYYRGELAWQTLSIFITYTVYKWIQKQKQKQPDWAPK